LQDITDLFHSVGFFLHEPKLLLVEAVCPGWGRRGTLTDAIKSYSGRNSTQRPLSKKTSPEPTKTSSNNITTTNHHIIENGKSECFSLRHVTLIFFLASFDGSFGMLDAGDSTTTTTTTTTTAAINN